MADRRTEHETAGSSSAQELLGHNEVRTTMVYTYVMEKAARRVCSPLDAVGVAR
jgi:site-specific recombinase XerD